ncbi:MAG: mechanosensitive ion channel protein MscS [Zetaproteobacteria bacterium CG1_02_49_23]|nr:MAG: mechanosensitive ion channel protein MscS [Zetaproteobacteria bacterium CG1_02_49_23]
MQGGLEQICRVNIGLALAIFIIGRMAIGFIIKLAHTMLDKAGTDPMLTRFVLSISRTVLLLFVIVAALGKLGVDTTSFIALIGAAGLAVGLALQGSLQNFAAGVLLIIFRPFKLGDFIEAGGVSGVVEQIGIFTSTLRTGDNREIIVPNGNIYHGNITNNSARSTRRIDMVFGIGYGDDLKKAKQLIVDILAADERILPEPAPLVVVGELAECSVNFNVRPWVNSGDYWAVYFDLNEKIKLAFDENGISIPFPQMDIHLNKSE